MGEWVRRLAQGAFAHNTLKGWLCLLYVSILGNALAHLSWVTGISKIGPTRTTMYQTFVPLVAIFFAVLFLGKAFFGSKLSGRLWSLEGYT